MSGALVLCWNCGAPAKYRGLQLCARCYQRFRANGDGISHARVAAVCCVPGCEAAVKAWGYCERHWQRVEKHGTPDGGKWSHDHSDRCSVPGCGGEHRAMGLCEKHYSREQRNGHPVWRTLGKRKVHNDRPWDVSSVVDSSKLRPQPEM